MPDQAPPGGGPPPNGNFNHVNVNTARVSAVRVDHLDVRTGQPRDGQNDLIDQIKDLGDKLNTSLEAMLTELKGLHKTTEYGIDVEEDHGEEVESDADREHKTSTEHLKTTKETLRASRKATASLDVIAKLISKSQEASTKQLIEAINDLKDATHQVNTGVNKDMTVGLKNIIGMHQTVMREVVQQIRDTAQENLKGLGIKGKTKINQRNMRYQSYWGAHEAGTGVTPEMAEEMMKPGQKFKRFMGNLGTSSWTYAKQKSGESSASGAEKFASKFDSLVGSFLGFESALSYAEKKLKQFGDVAGSGLDSFTHFMTSDFTKLFVGGDSLGNSLELIRRSAKEGFETADSQMFIAGKSLQQASEMIRNLRKDTQNSGFNTDAFMDFKDANEVLMDIRTQLKRSGILDRLQDDQVNRYMVDQLKAAQLTAENTGITVKEVQKMNAENAKKAAEFTAAGMLRPDQQGTYNNLMTRLTANKPLQNLFQQMISSGSFEQFAASDKTRTSGLIASGAYEHLRGAYDSFQRGDTEGAIAALMRGGKAAQSTTQANGSAVSGELMKGDLPQILASLNQLYKYESKNKPGEGDTVASMWNGLKDWFSNVMPLDALKALTGVPALLMAGNALLSAVVINTGGLGKTFNLFKSIGGLFKGKGIGSLGSALGSMVGLGEAAGAGAAATAGVGATAASTGAAGIVGGGLLKGLAGGVGKTLLKGVPILGGLAGGAIDKATGGSLLGAILSGAGTGAALGGGIGLLGGGLGAVPGALLGGLGGALTGGIGYGLASLFDGNKSAPVAPNGPSYQTGSAEDMMSNLGRGLYARLDTQIAKLDELITVIKTQNAAAVTNQATINQIVQPNSADVGETGSFLGTIRKLWG